MGARQAAAALGAVRIWSRIAPAALAAAVMGAPFARAESGDTPLRTLEALWQTAVPHPAQQNAPAWRLRVQDDNRFSLASRHALVTLDGTGKLRARVVLPARPNQDYAIVPLAGGDFLVQQMPARGQMRFARHAADGRLLFLTAEPLPADTNSYLHDATLLPDGRIAAMASLGPGPNNVMALVVLDPAGRRIADHRIELFAITLSYTARVYALLDGKALDSLLVLGTGYPPNGIRPFVQPFTFMGRAPVASLTQFLGEGALLCSALRPGGEPLVGTQATMGAGQPVVLRWYKRDGEEAAQRVVGEAERCEILLRADGTSLVWLAPRRLLAFDDTAKPLWRAAFADDVLAIGVLSDGDIAALHPAGTGINVVRYRLR